MIVVCTKYLEEFIYLKSNTVYAIKYDEDDFKVIEKDESGDKHYHVAAGFQRISETSDSFEDSNISMNNSEIKDVSSKQSISYSDVNPFNVIYTIIAILIVCVIFGAGYRKR